MWLLRERLSDFGQTSYIELIALYVHPKNSNHLRSHSRAIMALDHSRLGLENKFLENKSGRIFLRSTGLLYKFLPTNLEVCKPTFYTFYTSHLRWNSTIYHTDLRQNEVFHNFSRLIIYTKKILNSDWLRKECSSSVKRMQICNTSANYKWFLIRWRLKRNQQESIRLELF